MKSLVTTFGTANYQGFFSQNVHARITIGLRILIINEQEEKKEAILPDEKENTNCLWPFVLAQLTF